MSQADRERSPSVTTEAAAPVHATSPPIAPSTAPPGTSPGSNIPEQSGSETRHGVDAQPEAPPPPFEPLFTLLTNSTTNATVHPRVHYLFSDDDPGILASAAADPSQRALVVDLVPSAQHRQSLQQPRTHADNTASHVAAETAEGADWSVAWASSLSSDFAVTASQLAVQQHGGEGGGNLILRVEGVEREPVEAGLGDSTAAGGGSSGSLRNSGSGTVPGAAGREDVDGLLDDFRRRMDLLRKVVGEGDRRRAALDKQADEHHGQHQPQQDREQQPGHEGEGKAAPEGADKPTGS